MLIQITSHGIHGENWSINDEVWTHPTLGDFLYTSPNIAGTTAGAGLTSPNSWEEFVSESATGTGDFDEEESDKLQLPYWHKEGINILRLIGRVRRTINALGTPSSEHTAELRFELDGMPPSFSTTIEFTNSSYDDVELGIDVSSLPAGNKYTINISLYVDVSIPSAHSSGTASTTAELEQSITILDLT